MALKWLEAVGGAPVPGFKIEMWGEEVAVNLSQLLPDLHAGIVSLGILAAAIACGLIANSVGFAVLRRISARAGGAIEPSLERHCRAPARLVVPAATADPVLPMLRISPAGQAVMGHLISLVLIGAVAWLIVGLTSVAGDAILAKYPLEENDNLRARRIYTQIQVFRRTIGFIVTLIAFAAMLMTFGWARELGAGLLASAGIVGLAVGIAARPAIENLVASVQIALTEPIKIDDAVMVEGEFGRIEEILTTYVVVRTWDLRRLILPLSYFVEKPFQNWTRTTAEILGTVFLYVDYTCPIEPLRNELERLLEASPLWDQKVCALHVTNASERTVEVRALMSAANSGLAFDLRCEVREKLIDFIKRNYPSALPTARAELAEVRTRVVQANGGDHQHPQ
jgi:small-conductance mechanosensitive channel